MSLLICQPHSPWSPGDVHHGEPRVGAEGVRPHREDGAVRGPQPRHLQSESEDGTGV